MAIKNQKTVTYFLGNGLATPRKRVGLKEDLEVGTLVGIDKTTGKLVKATSGTSGSDYIMAVGVITTASTPTLESPRYMPNGSNVLIKDESQELYKYFTIGNIPVEEISDEDWKEGLAVYLGKDGKVTNTKPVAGGAQLIGMCGDKTRREVECNLIFPVEVVG